MAISILAIRCRYCGAEVGRPRKEQETFTVKDLGGEQITSYTLSGNVTEAMEAFMLEEQAQIEAKERERQEANQKSIFRRAAPNSKTASSPRISSSAGLGRDTDGRNLSSSAMQSRGSRSARSQMDSPINTPAGKAFVLALLVVVLVLLFFGWRYFTQTGPTADFVYPNHALDMLASGAGPLPALEEAVEALRRSNTSENQDILRRVREALFEDIASRAYAVPFDAGKVDRALADISRAARIDSNAQIIQLESEMMREVAYFKFILMAFDVEEGTATFKLNNAFVTQAEAQVSVGDLLQDRFLVKEIISRGVILEDTHPQAGRRNLLSRRMETVTAY